MVSLYSPLLATVMFGSLVTAKVISDVDIIIGGGSLSALAAALTAANVSRSWNLNLSIVLLEPTSWAGGQLTASSVPPDFGQQNTVVENLPQSFVDLLLAVAGPDWETNPGACWVSTQCFEANEAASYIKNSLLPSFEPHLKVYYDTVVKDVTLRDDTRSSNARISSVTGISRRPRNSANTGYEHSLSVDLKDWYSHTDSAVFLKETFVFELVEHGVVVEGTELADVLMTTAMKLSTSRGGSSKDSEETAADWTWSRQLVAQGVEYPFENSSATDSSCGQSTVLPFHISYSDSSAIMTSTAPASSDIWMSEGPSNSIDQSEYSLQGLQWEDAWTYRRVRSSVKDCGSISRDGLYCGGAVLGDQSNQNLDNDYTGGYLLDNSLLSSSTEGNGGVGGEQQEWFGGVNLTVLAGAERRSYGWYNFFKKASSVDIRPNLQFNITQSGTRHGLAMFPYIRDTRRLKRGLDGFRLLYSRDLNCSKPSDATTDPSQRTAREFFDTVAIGVYHYADVHFLQPGVCAQPYPEYLTCCEHPIRPYYIPFRALATPVVSNLLIAGKSIAQSFLANAATRLHPTEWSTGVAAGATAALLRDEKHYGWSSTEDVLREVGRLQAVLLMDEIRSPLQWTL